MCRLNMFNGAKILITGGCGYIGYNLAEELLSIGSETIVLFDLTPPNVKKEEHSNQNYSHVDYGTFRDQRHSIIYVEGDIRDYKRLNETIKNHNVNAVFHIAGFGLSGRSNLPVYDDITNSVNVLGTKNVVRACIENNVKALVFTSSVNVSFNGYPIINGNEENNKWLVCKCSDYHKINVCHQHHLDAYSKSKQDAEQIVLLNSTHLSDKTILSRKNGCHDHGPSFNGLRTCVLRLAGVYGPGEQTIVQRTLTYLESFISSFFILHKEDLKVDWLHIRNVIQAQIKAMDRLLRPNCDISGEIFYITDGNPTSTDFAADPLKKFAMKNNLVKKIFSMIPFLPMKIPESVAAYYASVLSLVAMCLGKHFRMPIWGFTPMESKKITVSHYFSIQKAEKLLDYHPDIRSEDWDEIVDKLNEKKRKDKEENWFTFKVCFVLLSGFVLCTPSFLDIAFL